MSTTDVPHRAIHAGGSEESTMAAYARCLAVLLRTGIWIGIVDPRTGESVDCLPQKETAAPWTPPELP